MFGIIVMMHNSRHWAVQYRGMFFGATAAVFAFHRVGAMIAAIVRRIWKAPMARYVDDCFSANRDDIGWTSMRCLDVVTELMGFHLDAMKSANDLLEMTVLGEMISILMASRQVSVRVAKEKAEKWTRELDELLQQGVCEAHKASQFAGRFAHTVGQAANRIGKAFIRPWYAQATASMARGAISPWLLFSISFFKEYLRLRPESKRSAGMLMRRHVRAWTDASGVDRWIAAVVLCDGRFEYCKMQLEEDIFEQMMQRKNHYIGIQEQLAITLLMDISKKRWQGR